jgi:hypothetical protein
MRGTAAAERACAGRRRRRSAPGWAESAWEWDGDGSGVELWNGSCVSAVAR